MISCDLPFESNFPYLVNQYAKDNRIPISLTMELTPFCNFSCLMCYVRLTPEQAKKQGEMLTKEQILKIANEAKGMGTLYLTLTGGEPLSRPDFWDIYKELNKMGFLISILSNGSTMDGPAIEKFKEYGMPYSVKLTLYGASNETYNKICGCPDGFTRIEKAIRLLKENKVPLTISGTMIRENAEDVAEMYRITRQWGVPFSHTVSVVKSVRGNTNNVENSRFLFGEFVDKLSLEQLEKHKLPECKSPFSWCASYKCSAWLTWNGHLQLCAFMNGPYSLISEGFENAWKELNEKLESLKTPDECTNCEYVKFCQRCPGLLCAESGSAEKVSDSVCDTAKKLYFAYKKLKEAKE